MNYVIEKLLEIESEARTALAERLLTNLQGTGLLPNGCYTTGDLEGVTKTIDEERKIYQEIERITPSPPEILFESQKRLEKSARQSLYIISLSRRQRFRVPRSKFPDYINDFNLAVRRQFSNEHGRISQRIRSLKFIPKRIGYGGFSEAYLAEGEEGTFVVRIAHPVEKLGYEQAKNQARIIQEIKENLTQKQDLFQERPFVRLFEVAPENNYDAICVMEYFHGNNVAKALKKGLDEDTKARVLRTYAKMLAFLHQRELLFLDNGWPNVLFSETDVAVCDYDLVSSISELEHGPFLGLRTLVTASREQILRRDFSVSSDLESFALMIDRLYNLDYFLELEKQGLNEGECQSNKRSYPSNRREALPRKLQDLVAPLVTYPKDHSITINDFLGVL